VGSGALAVLALSIPQAFGTYRCQACVRLPWLRHQVEGASLVIFAMLVSLPGTLVRFWNLDFPSLTGIADMAKL
jgi:hypothetical protein